jgi:tRNA threonylcarbamoyl adenosine modification protein YeaZ
MTILAIDTSTTRGSVAVLRDGEMLFAENFVADRSHSASLFVLLTHAKEAAGAFDRIVVGLGPGSYAGVRIAIAAAIGLQMANDAELLGIPSVAALETSHTHYVAVGDARRQTFYWSEIEDGVCTDGPRLLTEEEFRQKLAASTLPAYASEPVPDFPGIELSLPCATKLARLAQAERGVVARGPLEPIYLREPHITQPKERKL